jgi:hypothetical protein
VRASTRSQRKNRPAGGLSKLSSVVDAEVDVCSRRAPDGTAEAIDRESAHRSNRSGIP